MRLFIDDIRQAPDDSWLVCRTVQSAIKTIHQFGEEITDISFDHDISHQVGIGVGQPRPMPCGESFESVAHYLGLLWKSSTEWNHISVAIHSANPLGAQEIYNILNEYGLSSVIDPLPQSNRLEMVV